MPCPNRIESVKKIIASVVLQCSGEHAEELLAHLHSLQPLSQDDIAVSACSAARLARLPRSSKDCLLLLPLPAPLLPGYAGGKFEEGAALSLKADPTIAPHLKRMYVAHTRAFSLQEAVRAACDAATVQASGAGAEAALPVRLQGFPRYLEKHALAQPQEQQKRRPRHPLRRM